MENKNKKSQKLIKFTSYNQYLLEGLINHTLFFSNIYKFNDPFEGLFRYKTTDWDDKKFTDFYLNDYKGNESKLNYYLGKRQEFEEVLNKGYQLRYDNNGVCCFSDELNLENVKMWAHYADKNSGICLVFDKENLKFENKQEQKVVISAPTGPHQIKYVEEYLNLDPLIKDLSQKSFLTTKFIPWKEEKELRYISSRAGSYNFNTKSLLEIVFGLNILDNSKEAIKNIVRKEYPDVILKQTKLVENTFGLEFKEEYL